MQYLNVEIDEWRKIGIGLTLFGIFITFLGVILFFDKGLIAMGNMLFIAGVTLVIGVVKTMQFFFQFRKWKGTISFLGGFALILFGWPITGMIIEAFGFVNLFGDFFPIFVGFAQRVPIIGGVFRIPFVAHLLGANTQRLPV